MKLRCLFCFLCLSLLSPFLFLFRKLDLLASWSRACSFKLSTLPSRTCRNQMERYRCWEQNCMLQDDFSFVCWDSSTCNLFFLSSSTLENDWTFEDDSCFKVLSGEFHWHRSRYTNRELLMTFEYRWILGNLLCTCTMTQKFCSRDWLFKDCRVVRFRRAICRSIWGIEKRRWLVYFRIRFSWDVL